jgi:DNA-binding MarR family transcriptional regulator
MSVSERVGAVRAFNRFYTKQIGLLDKSYLQSPFSLSKMRVLYELAHREGRTASELSKELGLDPGYLSRMLMSFEKRGYIDRKVSAGDARQSHLSLTPRGRAAFEPFEAKAEQEIAGMLGRLSVAAQNRLIEAMGTIEELLGGQH